MTGLDGYRTSLPLEDMLAPDVPHQHPAGPS